MFATSPRRLRLQASSVSSRGLARVAAAITATIAVASVAPRPAHAEAAWEVLTLPEGFPYIRGLYPIQHGGVIAETSEGRLFVAADLNGDAWQPMDLAQVDAAQPRAGSLCVRAWSGTDGLVAGCHVPFATSPFASGPVTRFHEAERGLTPGPKTTDGWYLASVRSTTMASDGRRLLRRAGNKDDDAYVALKIPGAVEYKDLLSTGRRFFVRVLARGPSTVWMSDDTGATFAPVPGLANGDAVSGLRAAGPFVFAWANDSRRYVVDARKPAAVLEPLTGAVRPSGAIAWADGTLWAGGSDSGLLRSSDGLTWAPVWTTYKDQRAVVSAVGASGTHVLVFGTFTDSAGAERIFLGRLPRPALDGAALAPPASMARIATPPDFRWSGHWLSGTASPLLFHDGKAQRFTGAAWEPVETPATQADCSSVRGAEVLVTGCAPAFVSLDDGATFRATNLPDPHRPPALHANWHIIRHRTALVAYSADRLMVSPDGGPNFRPAALPPGAQALHILSTGNRLLGVLRATNGSLSLAFSDDSAATWRPVPGSAGIEYLERQGSRVFATAPGGGLRSGWAHYRVDVSATPPTLAELHFGTLSPQFGAGVEIDGVLVSPLDAGSAPPVHTVVVSRDGGVTWRPWVLGLDNPASPRVVALRLIGDSLFAVTGGPGKGVESAIYRAPLSEFRVP